MAFTSTPVNLSNCRAFYMYTVGTQVQCTNLMLTGSLPVTMLLGFSRTIVCLLLFLLWVLFHVFSIFCISSFGDRNCPQHQESTTFSTAPEASHLRVDGCLFLGLARVLIHCTQKALCTVTSGGQVHYYKQITWSYM